MKTREFTFPSADGKTAIHAVEWLPERAPRAVLQIVHGVSEYILRYAPFAEYLTERGFAVVGHDHLGHGGSVAPGSQPLYFGRGVRWEQVVEDVETLRRMSRARFEGLPYFLLGHSMGSFLARTHLIRYPAATDGAILMGTGQMPSALITGGRLVAALEALRVGEDKGSPLVQALSFKTYNRIFAPNRTEFDWLSVNEENVDRYIAHPLCGGNPSIGLFREMLRGMRFISKAEHLKQMDPNTPVLFISGDMDPVGDLGKGVRRACERFRQAGMRDVSLQLYPGLRHEILQEREWETVCEDLLRWMEARLPV